MLLTKFGLQKIVTFDLLYNRIKFFIFSAWNTGDALLSNQYSAAEQVVDYLFVLAELVVVLFSLLVACLLEHGIVESCLSPIRILVCP
jgi:hypothetical protein